MTTPPMSEAEMSEERIRELREWADGGGGTAWQQVVALCDALLASRREREEARKREACLVDAMREIISLAERQSAVMMPWYELVARKALGETFDGDSAPCQAKDGGLA